MTKQEDIQAGLEVLVENWLGGTGYSLSKKLSIAVLEYLHDNDVVLKRKVVMTRGEEPIGYAVEPLIGDK